MLTRVQCAACPNSLSCGWRYADADVCCPVCGRQVVHPAPNGGPLTLMAGGADKEVIAYLTPKTATAQIHLGLTRGVGVRKPLPLSSAVLAATDFVDWERCAAVIAPTTGAAVRCDVEPSADKSAAAIKWSRSLPNPVPETGLPGVLRLPGLHPSEWPFRVFPTPAEWLRVSPAGTGGPPNLVGLLDPRDAKVSFVVTLLADRVPVAVDRCEVSAETKDVFRHLGLQGLTVSFGTKAKTVLPGSPLRLTFTVAGRREPLDPIPFAVTFHLHGVASPVPYSALLSFRHKPQVRMTPGAANRGEVTVPLGGTPSEIDFFLVDESGPDAVSPRLDEWRSVTVAPEVHGHWMSQAAALPPKLSTDPAEPNRLRMRIDTGRLSRAPGQFANRTHDVTVTVHDLDGYELATRQVRVHFTRMPPLPGVIGFDWGTTNNCAAVGEGDVIRSLALDPNAADEFERFSSALFVKELPEDGPPVIAVGTEAHELIEVSEHRECVVRGLKRRFLTGLPIRLRDAAGRQREFPVEVVVELYLRQMAEYVEQLTGREVGYLGLTYPTKWPASARERLERTVARVQERLARGRPGVTVVLVPPVLDEATAVALSAVRDVIRQADAEPAGFAADQGLFVVAYDFGGGTIDTVVLRTEFRGDHELHTRLIGVGGRPDFGGDDITRGILVILRKRMADALAGLQGGWEFPVQLAEEPDRTDRSVAWNTLATQNAERLWRRAEEIKRAMCRPADPDAADPVTAALDRIELEQLRCSQPFAKPVRSAAEFPTLGTVLQPPDTDLRDAFVAAVRFSLADVYATPAGPGTTVSIRQRLEETFAELRGLLAEQPQADTRVVVLAGGACRLPLVGQLAAHYLIRNGVDRLDFRETFAKQRVAHGNAWHLTFRHAGQESALDLTPPSEVSHRPLVFQRVTLRGTQMTVVVPAGSPLDAPALWHPATAAFERGKPVLLWTREWRGERGQPLKVGEFSRTPDRPFAEDKLLAEELPTELTGSVAVGIRLVRSAEPGGPFLIQMRVQPSGRTDWLGPYPLVPLGHRSDAREILQGVLDE